MTSLLQDDVDWTPESAQEFLETIDEETDRLNALVGNLLDMSRLQTGALEILRSRVGLEEVLAGGAEQPRRDATTRSSSTCPRPCPASSPIPALLERALANVDRQRGSLLAARSRRSGSRRGRSTACVDVRVVDRGRVSRSPIGSGCSCRSSASATRAGRRRRARARGRERVRRGDGRRDRGRGHARRRTDDRRRRHAGAPNDPHPRRRRRAADPARARDEPARAGLRRRARADRRGSARPSPRASTPTSSSSTSACPGSTGSR